MAYDKKLLAAARRELERERTAHTEELEARRVSAQSTAS